MASIDDHYDALFSPLVSANGSLDPETLTGLVGFTAGGPVSVATIRAAGICATCELSLNPKQVPSVEGLHFELFTVGCDPDAAQSVLTAIGDLSLDTALGHAHTVGIAPLSLHGVETVRLELYSQCEVRGAKYGLFRVASSAP